MKWLLLVLKALLIVYPWLAGMRARRRDRRRESTIDHETAQGWHGHGLIALDPGPIIFG